MEAFSGYIIARFSSKKTMARSLPVFGWLLLFLNRPIRTHIGECQRKNLPAKAEAFGQPSIPS